jgi:5-methylcytosine-specific restriction endonuclease McrA
MTEEQKIKNRERAKEYYKANRAKVIAYQKEYSKNNRDKINKRANEKYEEKIKPYSLNYYQENREQILKKAAIYREKNKDIIAERDKSYAKRKPEKLRAIKSRRKKKVRIATPKWLTKEKLLEIEAFYLLAIELEKETGIPHQVDHIVPIQGKEVCGLHVPWNLQVLTQKENRQKSNKLLDKLPPIGIS